MKVKATSLPDGFIEIQFNVDGFIEIQFNVDGFLEIQFNVDGLIEIQFNVHIEQRQRSKKNSRSRSLFVLCKRTLTVGNSKIRVTHE